MITRSDIEIVLSTILEPKLKWNIITLGLLKNVTIDEKKLTLEIHLVTEKEDEIKEFKKNAINALKGIYQDEIELIIKKANVGTKGIGGVKKIIMVASGKGGVGKSTVAVNLALSLAQKNNKVGLLDADIYGPSIPTMLGMQDKKPSVMADENLKPLESNGVKFISIGSLVESNKALSWRGQVVSGTIVQFIKKTAWEDLDYLVIDMPPGTGDIQLTIASTIKIDGVLVVTTPGEVVWGDVVRSIELLKEQKIPLLGLVENMSYLVCENCEHHNHPFDDSSKILQDVDIEVLASFPLDNAISKASNSGTPIVAQKPLSEISKKYQALSAKIETLLNN